MAIFAVFRVADPLKMNAAMHSAFPENHVQVGPGEWLVSASGTAKDISDKLGVTGETTTGAAIIFSMANYYGRATTEIWDWIKSKAESPGG
jgi:hypothetical protein